MTQQSLFPSENEEEPWLDEEEQDTCTCGLIGPWRKVREQHLTTCAVPGGEAS